LPPLVMKRESIRKGIELLEQALADGGVKDG
jgi:4-aminobutyrate aminotransferase-like enzyme